MKRMKPITALMAGLALAATTTTVVFAANAHYKSGGQPVCTTSISGSTVTASCSTGEVTGLGNFDVKVQVSVSASADTFCHNPGNPDNIVPGQNPAIATSTSTLNISADQLDNGNLEIPAISTTATVTAPTAQVAGCPNKKWTVTLGPVTFGPGVYDFFSPPNKRIPALSFTF